MKIKVMPILIGLFLVLNLHLLRNMSLVGYMAVLMLLYVPLLLLAVLRVITTVRPRLITMGIVFFLATAFMATALTIFQYGVAAGLYAAVRYFLTFPLVFISYTFIDTESRMRTMLRIYVIFITIALLTIPLQYIIGPISWFAEPGERANLVRYASILGSLTSAGVVVPFAIFIILVLDLRTSVRVLLLAGILIAAVFSLQKAAIFGALLAAVMYLMLMGRHNIKQVFLIFLVVVIIGGIANYLLRDWPVWQNAAAYVMAALRLNEESSALGGDFTVAQSLVDRLTSLPAASLSDLLVTRGQIGILTGGGFGMVGAALMRPGDSPFITAHNGYVDFLLIGGIFHVAAVLLLMVEVLLESWRIYRYDRQVGERGRVPLIFVGVVLITLISLTFGGGITFQPNGSALLWIIVGYVWRVQNRVSLPRGLHLRWNGKGLTSRMSDQQVLQTESR